MGLQGANKSAHWDGWEIEKPLELYCIKSIIFIFSQSMTSYLMTND